MTLLFDAPFSTISSATRRKGDEGEMLFIIKKESLDGEYALVSSAPLSQRLENFQPNFMAYRFPIPVQLIETEQNLQIIKQDRSIYRHEMAEIGAALSLSIDGLYLNLIPKSVIDADYYVPIQLRVYLRQSYQMPEFE